MVPTCSECNSEIPPYSGKRRWTCSPECSRLRAARHPNRPRKGQQPCSECGGECPTRAGKGAPFLTCSETCARVRRNRLGQARRDANRAPTRICGDCGDPLGRPGPGQRCGPCGREYHRQRSNDLARQRRAERRTEGGAPLLAEQRKRFGEHLKSVYGITVADYWALVSKQGGLCAVCGNPPDGRGKTNTLVVDHCHKSGQVRELLCGYCNAALGLLQDDPEVAVRAAEYLRRHAL